MTVPEEAWTYEPLVMAVSVVTLLVASYRVAEASDGRRDPLTQAWSTATRGSVGHRAGPGADRHRRLGRFRQPYRQEGESARPQRLGPVVN